MLASLAAPCMVRPSLARARVALRPRDRLSWVDCCVAAGTSLYSLCDLYLRMRVHTTMMGKVESTAHIVPWFICLERRTLVVADAHGPRSP